jgi:hypothetical protein
MVVIYLIMRVKPLLTDFMKTIETNVRKPFSSSNSVDNTVLLLLTKHTSTPIEETGAWLRSVHDSDKNRINYKRNCHTGCVN